LPWMSPTVGLSWASAIRMAEVCGSACGPRRQPGQRVHERLRDRVEVRKRG
jgi:hypothetical protein